MREIRIGEQEAGQRLDKFLGKYMGLAPKGFLYKMLRKKNITLNGKRADGGEKLAAGDQIRLFLAEETVEKFTDQRTPAVPAEQGAEKPPFSVIYEDQDILILNKPWGMLTQKAAPSDLSLNEYMTDWLLASGRLSQEALRRQRPSVCNRLDRNTSGIVTAGITLKGLQGLSRILKDRSCGKWYWALVWGEISQPRQIRGYLRKEAGNRAQILSGPGEGTRPVETAYRPLARGGGCTLLEVHLITGRSHQIRAQLSAEGHFIIGDPKYGRPEINQRFEERFGLAGQLLHAGRFAMPDQDCPFPGLAGRVFQAPLEERFSRVLDGLGIPRPDREADAPEHRRIGGMEERGCRPGIHGD